MIDLDSVNGKEKRKGIEEEIWLALWVSLLSSA